MNKTVDQQIALAKNAVNHIQRILISIQVKNENGRNDVDTLQPFFQNILDQSNDFKHALDLIWDEIYFIQPTAVNKQEVVS